MIVTSFAPAKVNLYLHVGAPRPDGMHPLDSLVAFAAQVGDLLSAAPAEELSLTVSGPFAHGLAEESDNLVLRAARLLAAEAGVRPVAALQLHKALPIASGLGGGSSDAAAALRVLNMLWELNAAPEDLERLGAKLGSDVPCCVRAQPCRMRGVGEIVSPASIPPLAAVLVNPGAASPTGPVYKAFDALSHSPEARPPQTDIPSTPDGLVGWLRGARNDLERPAASLTPAIDETLQDLQSAAPGALVRLSGSGATCVALFSDADHADEAAARFEAAHPSAWVKTATLGAADVTVARMPAGAAL